jgi:hypothetical protein
VAEYHVAIPKAGHPPSRRPTTNQDPSLWPIIGTRVGVILWPQAVQVERYANFLKIQMQSCQLLVQLERLVIWSLTAARESRPIVRRPPSLPI